MVAQYSVIGEWLSTSVCFFVFILLLWRGFQVVWVQQKPAFPSNVKIIQAIIPLALLTRALVMTLNLLEGEDPSIPVYNQSQPYQVILGGLPGYLYFGVYSILCLAFVERYQIWNLGTIASRIILVGILSFVLIAFLTFGFISIYQSDGFQETGHTIETIFSTTIHSLLAIVFIAMGISSIIFSLNTAAHKTRQKSQHNSVAILANVTGLVFFAKGAFIGVSAFVKGGGLWRLICHWVYVLFFEVCLALAISLVLSWSLPSTVGAGRLLTPADSQTLLVNQAQDTIIGPKRMSGGIISFSPSDFED